ncbi:ankyrin repeat domain-containing protein [Nostoc sp.]
MPLMYVIKDNRLEILEWLIVEELNIKAIDDFGNTACKNSAPRSQKP